MPWNKIPHLCVEGRNHLKCPRFTFVEYFQLNTILIGEESVSLLHLMISIIHIFEYQWNISKKLYVSPFPRYHHQK